MAVKNDEGYIENSIKSLLPLDGDILIADLGSKDNSINLCERLGAKSIKIGLNNDFSAAKNKLIQHAKTEWIMFVEPWEVMITPKEEVLSLFEKPGVYRSKIIQDEMITESINLWSCDNKIEFHNPVFETINSDSQKTNIYFSSKENNRNEINSKILEIWRNRMPLSSSVSYYWSHKLLIEKKWDQFINEASSYLFKEKEDIMPITMTRYYLAMVQAVVKKNYNEAVKNIVFCLSVRPLMAEFWCLLGDIYYSNKKYEKALTFYENAIILGSSRMNGDEWPVEVAKYKKYPQKMIESCEKILRSMKSYREI